MRMENANNLNIGNKYMIAVWFKLHPIWYYGIWDWDIITQRRYSSYQNPIFSLGMDYYNYDDVSKTYVDGRFSFQQIAHRYNETYSTTYNYIGAKTNTSVQEGWYLVSVAVDSANQNTQATLRIRQPDGRYDNYQATWNYWLYNYSNSYYGTDKSDIYVGGYCQPYYGYERGLPVTISKLYIWKNFANLNQHNIFDRFFFRNNGLYTANNERFVLPLCVGSTPCSFCVVDYEDLNVPISNVIQLKCSTSQDKKQYLFADWDFDHPSNTQTSQYILDQSGNGNHMAKVPVNDVESSEFIRIIGQGLVWYIKDNVQTKSIQYFNLGQFQQFTGEVWLKRIHDGAPPTSQSALTAIPLWIMNSNSKDVIKWTLSEESKSQRLCFGNECEWAIGQGLPDTYLNDQKWHFASVGMVSYRIWLNQGFGTSVRLQADNSYTIGKYGSRDWSGFQIPYDSQIMIGAFKTVVFRSIKIYNFIKYKDEAPLMFSQSTNCAKIGTQPQCDICPSDTKKCLSVCNENEYGDNCDKCHSFCGHCTGPTKDDCIFCARKVSPANVFYSQTFGNCTCLAGKYYNSTTDKCETCDPLCQECYGPDNTMCLTCKNGKIFIPDTICVDNCKDPLVVNDTLIGYYQTQETINGVVQATCTKCHHYCTECTGPLNKNCQKCQEGYFLQGGNTCYSTCPDGQYPEVTSRECKPCHGDCKTCFGPNNDNCLLCSSASKFQQFNKCINKCDNGYTPDSNNICLGCYPSCATCTTFLKTDCQSCVDGYYLVWLGTSCETSCINGTYADSLTNTCQLCHYSCETCSSGSPDSCTKCAPGFLRRGSFCVTQCADSEYVVNGVCRTCDSKCQTCYGTLDTQCYTCSENTLTGIGYFYFNESCLEKCPDGFYPDNLRRICRKCNPRCSTCLSESFCTSCIYGPYQLNNGECTFFTCLDTQYRTIKPNLACYECDPSCLTCQGQSRFDCMTCKPQNRFEAQQCLSCTQQPGMTDPVDDTPGCVEICGDGFNYGFFQCDDGNLVNGDGCSSKCLIESGFNCTVGSKLAPSVCMDNKNPTPRISLVSSKNSIYIEFDEEVQLQQALDENTLKVTITGSQSSYKFDWRLADVYKNPSPTQMAIIELTLYSSIKGDSKEQVTIQFLSDQVYKDATGNGIFTVPLYAFLNKFDYIDPETKAQLDAAGDTSMFATFGAVAINLVISQLFGGSIAAMWTMVNTIQLISLLPLCNINYPKLTVMVLEKMLTSHGESTMIPNVFYDYLINRPESKVKIEQAYNDRFKSYGWNISNFLYLSGRKILLWTLLIFAYPFVWYMKRKYADKHKFCQLWIKAEQKFRYTMLLRGVIMSYVSMYLAFVLGIFKMDLTTMENTISAFFAIAFGIILTYLPMQLMNILQRNYEKINTEKFMLAYSTIVKEVDLSHPIRYMYYPVFLMRRALFAISLVLFANEPVQQIGFMTATAFVMIIYVVVIKPQKEKIMIILTAFGEILLMFLHLYSLVFLDETLPEEKANTYGMLMLAIIGLYILSNWVVIIVITVKQLKGKWKELKSSKLVKKKKIQDDIDYRRWKKKRHLKLQMDHEQDKQQMLSKLDEVTQNYKKKQLNNQLNQTLNNNNNLYSIFTQYQEEGVSPTKGSPGRVSPRSQFSQFSPNIYDHLNAKQDDMLTPTKSQNQYEQFPTLNDMTINQNVTDFHQHLDLTQDNLMQPAIFNKSNNFIKNQIDEQMRLAAIPNNKNVHEASKRYQSSFAEMVGTANLENNVKSPGRIKADRYASEDINNLLVSQSFSQIKPLDQNDI